MVLVISVVLGTLIVISSHHWFTIWVGLEMNTLSILPIISYQFTPRNVESSVKYFLIQSVRAGFLLNVVVIQAWLHSSWSLGEPLKELTSFLITFALGLKLGLFPCHYWFPDVIQGVGFLQGLVLSTWQKVAPFVIISRIRERLNVNLILIMGVISVLVGGWGGLNQTQVRKILAFSSIAHMGWICRIIVYSTSVRSTMLIVYIFINSSVFLLVKKMSLNSLSSMGRLPFYSFIRGFGLVISILSLGGLPPLLGFFIKFISLHVLVAEGNFIICRLLIVGRLLSLFYYLRIAFKRRLLLFPQHLLLIFRWRKGLGAKRLLTFEGVFLSVGIRIRLLGLFCFPIFISLLK